MGINIFFIEDIVRILAALAQANARNGTKGYQEALDDVALAFGIYHTEVKGEQIEPVQRSTTTEPERLNW